MFSSFFLLLQQSKHMTNVLFPHNGAGSRTSLSENGMDAIHQYGGLTSTFKTRTRTWRQQWLFTPLTRSGPWINSLSVAADWTLYHQGTRIAKLRGSMLSFFFFGAGLFPVTTDYRKSCRWYSAVRMPSPGLGNWSVGWLILLIGSLAQC